MDIHTHGVVSALDPKHRLSAFVRVAAQDLVLLQEIWIWSMARFDVNYGAVALSE